MVPNVDSIARATTIPPAPRLLVGQQQQLYYSKAHLQAVAEALVAKKIASSKLLSSKQSSTGRGMERIPKFAEKELHLGKVLGRGGFSVVYDITKLPALRERACLATVGAWHHPPSTGHGRLDSWWRRKSQAPRERYVLKRLKPVGQSSNAQLYVQAVMDIVMEARFLSVLNHPHILQLRGTVVDTRPESLVLERLVEGLEQRLQTWKKKAQPWWRTDSVRARAHWYERIRVASHIASAVSYLHEHAIVFRDLKPDNVGFDECGNVKLFDFGLARELSLADRDENGMYLLTAETGSPRYMDPIIVGYGKSLSEKERYNELVDVYSFCIFLWQMLALEAPYACYQTFSSFHKKVVSGGVRPRCHEAWPSSLCSMMRLGWGDIRCRLPMKNITSELQRQLGESPDPSNSEKSNLAVVSSSTGQLEAMLRQMGIGDEKDAETASISAYSDEGNLEEQSEAHKQEPTSFLSVALDACCFSCCPLQTKQP